MKVDLIMNTVIFIPYNVIKMSLFNPSSTLEIGVVIIEALKAGGDISSCIQNTPVRYSSHVQEIRIFFQRFMKNIHYILKTDNTSNILLLHNIEQDFIKLLILLDILTKGAKGRKEFKSEFWEHKIHNQLTIGVLPVVPYVAGALVNNPISISALTFSGYLIQDYLQSQWQGTNSTSIIASFLKEADPETYVVIFHACYLFLFFSKISKRVGKNYNNVNDLDIQGGIYLLLQILEVFFMYLFMNEFIIMVAKEVNSVEDTDDKLYDVMKSCVENNRLIDAAENGIADLFTQQESNFSRHAIDKLESISKDENATLGDYTPVLLSFIPGLWRRSHSLEYNDKNIQSLKPNKTMVNNEVGMVGQILNYFSINFSSNDSSPYEKIIAGSDNPGYILTTSLYQSLLYKTITTIQDLDITYYKIIQGYSFFTHTEDIDFWIKIIAPAFKPNDTIALPSGENFKNFDEFKSSDKKTYINICEILSFKYPSNDEIKLGEYTLVKQKTTLRKILNRQTKKAVTASEVGLIQLIQRDLLEEMKKTIENKPKFQDVLSLNNEKSYFDIHWSTPHRPDKIANALREILDDDKNRAIRDQIYNYTETDKSVNDKTKLKQNMLEIFKDFQTYGQGDSRKIHRILNSIFNEIDGKMDNLSTENITDWLMLLCRALYGLNWKIFRLMFIIIQLKNLGKHKKSRSGLDITSTRDRHRGSKSLSLMLLVGNVLGDLVKSIAYAVSGNDSFIKKAVERLYTRYFTTIFSDGGIGVVMPNVNQFAYDIQIDISEYIHQNNDFYQRITLVFLSLINAYNLFTVPQTPQFRRSFAIITLSLLGEGYMILG